MDRPRSYKIRIEGLLSGSWASWFDGLEIRHEGPDQTVLTGLLVDQAALHGVLMRIRDLGLPLISVDRVDQPERQEPDRLAAEEQEP